MWVFCGASSLQLRALPAVQCNMISRLWSLHNRGSLTVGFVQQFIINTTTPASMPLPFTVSFSSRLEKMTCSFSTKPTLLVTTKEALQGRNPGISRASISPSPYSPNPCMLRLSVMPGWLLRKEENRSSQMSYFRFCKCR
jgi:hypothetical protein